MARWLLPLGCVVMALGVALGAYAAHATRGAPHPQAALLLQTAVLYMLVHGLALVIEGVLARAGSSRWLAAAAGLHVAGLVLFCGSLWVMALTGASPGVVPIGGTCFILGWLALAGHATWGLTPE